VVVMGGVVALVMTRGAVTRLGDPSAQNEHEREQQEGGRNASPRGFWRTAEGMHAANDMTALRATFIFLETLPSRPGLV